MASVPFGQATRWVARLSRYHWPAQFFVDAEDLGACNEWETVVRLGHTLGMRWSGDTIPDDPQIEAAAQMLKEIGCDAPHTFSSGLNDLQIGHFRTYFAALWSGSVNEAAMLDRDAASVEVPLCEDLVMFKSMRTSEPHVSPSRDLLQRAQDDGQWLAMELTEDGWQTWSDALFKVGIPVLSTSEAVRRLVR